MKTRHSCVFPLMITVFICMSCASTEQQESAPKDAGTPAEPGQHAAKRDYKPVTVLDLKYGPAEAQPGYLPPLESDETAPDAIAVTAARRILINDPAKYRIAVYDLARREYLRSITRDGHMFVGVTWHPGGIATIDWEAREVVLFDEEGRLIHAQPFAETFWHRTWGLNASNEGIRLWTDSGNCLVFKGNRTLVPVPAEQQLATAVEGESYGNHIYQTYRVGSRVVQRSLSGETVREFSLGEEVSEIRVFGEDAQGCIYVFASAEPGTGRCVIFDKQSEELSRFDLLASGEGVRLMDLWVTPDGTVFQLWHDETRIRVIAFGLE